MNIMRLAAFTVALSLGGASAANAEMPVFELWGFPISSHQVQVVGSAHIRERSAPATLTLSGMPASPHQVAVLTPRPRLSEQQVRDRLETNGFSQVRFLVPSEYTIMGLQDSGWVTLTVDSRTGEVR